MIELTQQPDLAIGSKTAIEEFSKKECAKLLVLSDSHGNPQILQSIITSFGPICDAMCFCGDGIFDLVYALELAFNDKKKKKKIFCRRAEDISYAWTSLRRVLRPVRIAYGGG